MIGGYDAMLGNPPWVSYAGRAAQPIDDRRRMFYMAFYRSFAGYRNLQGMFVEESARLLREGGRLGLVIPSSMAELDGYGPSRAAHDAMAECDAELPVLGEDAFRGVAQPCMALHSTRRAGIRDAVGDAWPIARPDLDDGARALLARLDGPRLPPGLFGERGVQSSGADAEHFHESAKGTETASIRVGGDIRAFERGVPSLHADVAWFGSRLRSAEQWGAVKVLIRQTARVPIAARSDGAAFRNSILAGFEDAEYPGDFLVAYLNSTPVRWAHYYSNRDARLGMPQVKIGHLRGIPAPREVEVVARVAEMGAAWSARNQRIGEGEQRELDAVVARGLGLGDGDLERMRRDARAWS